MKIQKANWHSEGQNLRLAVPFAKVDEERRTVSGFATLDNVDRMGDIVLADASVKAFERFRGNLREMHQSIAVGKVLGFAVEEFYDPETAKMYSGIFVTAYVSKGAQDSWEKVLDGTLSGFSIGGIVKDSEPLWDADLQQTLKIIKDYDLVELSLVDSPANQLANVYSVIKMDSAGTTIKGMAAETQTSNVFWCQSNHEGQVAVLSKDESATCMDCNGQLENIGWVETADTQKSEAVKELVEKFLNTNSVPEIRKQAQTDNSEGGNEVANEETVVEEVEVTEKAVVLEEAPEVTDEAEGVITSETVEEVADEADVEKAADVSEVDGDVEPDFTKQFDDLKSFIGSELTKGLEAVSAATASMEEMNKSFDSRFEEISKKYDSLASTVDALIKNVDDVEKNLGVLDAATAVKKSNELENGSEDKIEKGLWSGHFLGVRTISE